MRAFWIRIIGQKLDKLAECGWSRNSSVVLCSDGKLRKLDVGTENTTYTQGMAGRISKRDKTMKRWKVRVRGEE